LEGGVEEAEMLRTFNCGIGMIVVVAAEDETPAIETLRALGEPALVIGKIIAGEPGVAFTGRL